MVHYVGLPDCVWTFALQLLCFLLKAKILTCMLGVGCWFLHLQDQVLQQKKVLKM